MQITNFVVCGASKGCIFHEGNTNMYVCCLVSLMSQTFELYNNGVKTPSPLHCHYIDVYNSKVNLTI